MTLTDERAIQAVKAALRWMKAHSVVWLKTEEKVYSRKYDFAGTTDGLAYVDSCSDPACCTEEFKHSLCLIDFKTSNQLKDEYCLQTAAYQQALHEETGTIIDNRWLLRLGKNEEEAGKFETWRLPASTFAEDLSGFIACLNLVRITESIKERMKTQKVAIRAVKKEQRETAKTLKKEQEKLEKALAKAEAKKLKEVEKERLKTEAKANREAAKAAKKAGVVANTKITEETNDGPSVLPEQNRTTHQPAQVNDSPKETQTNLGPDRTVKSSVPAVCAVESQVQYKPITLPGEK